MSETQDTIPLKSFYFIRHRKTDWSLETKIQGHTDIPLNNIGISETEELRLIFEKLNITHLHSSALSRAYETVNILNKNINLPIHTYDDLKESSKGNLEGITSKEYDLLDQDTINNSIENPIKFQERTKSALTKILSTDGIPCIVSHSGNLRCISKILSIDMKSIKDVSFNKIWYFEVSGDKWKLSVKN